MSSKEEKEEFQNFDEEKVEDYFSKKQKEAEELLNDEDKVECLLQKLEKKLKTVPCAGSSLAYVPIMISMVRMYIKKEYTDAPVTSIVSILVALIYVLSPVDFIPDGIPVLGLSDDAAVVYACLMLVKTDIEDYKIWRKENNMEIEDIPDYEELKEESEKDEKIARAFFKMGRSKNNKEKKGKK